MKRYLILWSIALLSMAADGGETLLLQREQSFTINLQGSVAQATPLFGPIRETEWAPHWKPHFLHPTDGAQREGVIFQTNTGPGEQRLWLLTAYDAKEGRVEYVVITPGSTANEIKIRLKPDGEGRCQATITYRHSALAPKGNEEVNKLTSTWAEEQRIHWETAINAVLAKRPIP